MNVKIKKSNLLCDILILVAIANLIFIAVFLKDSDAILLIIGITAIFICLFVVLMIQLKIISNCLFNREKNND